MYYNLKSLYSKDVAKSFDTLTEIVEDIYDQLKERGIKVIWEKEKRLSFYGITVNDSTGKNSVNFGMWHSIWEIKGYPLCIMTSTDHSHNYMLSKFNSIADQYPDMLTEKFEIDGADTRGILLNFFETKEPHIKIVELILRVISELNFGLTPLRKQ